MMNVNMEKDVTLIKEVKRGTFIKSVKYKELEQWLSDEDQIQVKYRFGDKKKRIKQLNELGYSLHETIWYNDEEPSSLIQEVWSR
jgi:hypothetical protein